MAKKKPLKQLTIKVTEEKAETIKKYALKYHDGNTAKTIREFVDKGLSINSYKDEISFLREMIREEIKSSIDPKMERLIKLQVKTGIVSAGAFFLNSDVLYRLVDEEDRQELEIILENAKKKGVAYIQIKDSTIDEITKEKKGYL